MHAARPTIPTAIAALLLLATGTGATAQTHTYKIVDTGQTRCYDADSEISCPAEGQPFHGQDAQHDGNQPSFTMSADGLTVDDEVTGLTWVALPDTDGDGILTSPDDKLTHADAVAFPAVLNAQNFGGFDDWRLPSIKELYSLIDFSGIDPSGYEGDVSGLVPFIDTDFFTFVYGNEDANERIIDSQYASSTLYVGAGPQLLFGVNFADGRIKGYGLTMPGGVEKTFFVQCCRGNEDNGTNAFVDNGDGTVTDTATGLMWQQADSGEGMIWQDALAHAEALELAGHDDWRLPNAKELQSILDYTRSPSTHGTAAIDPVFACTQITDEGGDANFPFFWSGTTHANWTQDHEGSYGAYVAFGEALGYMDGQWVDVHGAGAQRSDPKTGDPDDYPYGHGPQGDAIRIYNFVRCVRDADISTGISDEPDGGLPSALALRSIAPNPFNPTTTISFDLPAAGSVCLQAYDVRGNLVRTLVDGARAAGTHDVIWDGSDDTGSALPSGTYLLRLDAAQRVVTRSLTLVK